MGSSHVIALVEPYWTGHPETQLKLFADALLQCAGHTVAVLCKHPEAFQSWIADRPASKRARFQAFPFAYCEEHAPFPSAQLASWARMNQALSEAENALGSRIDRVLITWLDPFICREAEDAARLMPRPWAGLYLFPSYLRRHPIRSRLFGHCRPDRMRLDQAFFRSPTCRALAVLDEGIRARLETVAQGIPVHALPDVPETSLPQEPSPQAREVHARARGRTVIGLPGVLGRRKGTLPFLKAIREADPSRLFFLIAGRLGKEERWTYGDQRGELDSLLADARTRENVMLHLEHVESEETLNGLLAACSALYLVYDDHHHSSGLLGKAAYLRKPVVCADRGCMAERVRAHSMGLRIPPDSTAWTLAAISRLGNTSELAALSQGADFDCYLAKHNRTALGDALERLLEGWD